jgi:hypothetical protein
MAKKQISKNQTRKTNKQSLNYKFKQNKAKSLVGLIFILVIAFVGVKLLFNSFAAVTYNLNAPPVGIAASSTSTSAGTGYWIAASDGGVFAEGNATFYGSMGGQPLSAPIVGIAANPLRTGYYLVGADGAVYAFNAPYHGGVNNAGSGGGTALIPGNRIVGMAVDPANGGYDLVDNQGHIYGFGGAPYFDVISWASPSNKQITSISFSSSGNGFYALTNDGVVLSFGDVAGQGASTIVGAPVGIFREPGTNGFVLTTQSGCTYAYSGAQYYGGMCGKALNGSIVGLTVTPDGKGYWLVGSDGGVFAFGDATYAGSVSYTPPVVAAPDCSKVPNSHLDSGACVCNTGFNTTAFGCLAPTTPAEVVPLTSTSTGVPPQKSTGGTLVCTDKNASPVNGICKCNSGYVYTDYGCETVQVYCSNMGKIYNSVYGCVPITSTNNAAGPGYTTELNRNQASSATDPASLLGQTGHNCLPGFGWHNFSPPACLDNNSKNVYTSADLKYIQAVTGITIYHMNGANNYGYICNTNFCGAKK